MIVPIVGNCAGPKAIRSVATYLKQHDAVVSAFYLSNVEQYLRRDAVRTVGRGFGRLEHKMQRDTRRLSLLLVPALAYLSLG